MLELGDHAPRLHLGLAEAIAACGVDRVYTAGPTMRHLHAALPAARRGEHVDDAAALLPILEHELRRGDTLLIKGSLGMRMGRIVDALLGRGRPERRVGARGR
jgi:UDP-N-acetylmuramoyl-tripeptide--D-alanyl-D-alanine ligase